MFCRRLEEYLRPHADSLAPATRARLERGGAGVAQILESTHEADSLVLENAPRVADSLDRESVGHFVRVRQALDALGVDHVVDPRLVRGLAYYTHTAFELVADKGPAVEALGSSQATVLAGGRYDGLVARLGGAKGDALHAFGWAAGIERLDLVGQALATDAWLEKDAPPAVLVAAMDDDLTVQDAALMAARGTLGS